MTYYKAFDPDFRDECDIQYAIGKETIVENPYQPNFIYAWGRCDTKLEACVRDLPMLMGYCKFDAKPHICEVEPNGKMIQRDDIIMRKQIPYYLTNRITVTRELTVDETMQRLWDEGANFNSFITAHAPFEELMKLKEHFNNIDTVRRILSLPYLTDKQFRELLPQKYHKYIDDWYWI